jgi:hypothetical protein
MISVCIDTRKGKIDDLLSLLKIVILFERIYSTYSANSISNPEATKQSRVTVALYGHMYFIIHATHNLVQLISLPFLAAVIAILHIQIKQWPTLRIYNASLSLVFLCRTLTLRRQSHPNIGIM